VLAGRTLEMVRVRDLVAYVRAAKGRATVPRWMGGKFPLSSELADAVRRELHSIAAAPHLADALASDALRAIAPLLAAQARRSRLPCGDQVLVERTRTREGWHLFVFPFAGRHVNEGLAALLAQRLCEQQPNSFSFSINDYGFELLGEREFVCDESALRGCFRADEAALQRDLLAAINASELARRQFREIARIAGLVQQSPPGQQKSARQLQASAGLLFDTLSRYDPEHVLIELAHREVLERHLNLPDVLRWLRDLQQKTLLIADVEQLSPLAFPLWASRLRGGLSNESASERIERMAKALERADG
jgi:ATP-dependent Lhr-like helicase